MDPATSAGSSGATTIFGKYTVGRLLGEGSFAKVYLCHSIKTNSPVAIKVINKSIANKSNANKDMAPYILREVAAMRRLNHPNIIQIHELLATKTDIYLVIELARGRDLQKLLSSRSGRRLPLTTALRIFHQLVSALHFCHQHGVTHRDLKPHNILLDQEGNVKLSDFGLSAVGGEGSASTELLLKSQCGTLVFMAPEIMQGWRYDGVKTDSWSCGVILYLMLVGNLPFNHKDAMNVMCRKMLGREFRLPSYLTEPIMGLINRILDPNPGTRMSIGDIVRESWFKTSGFGPKEKPLEDLVMMNEGSFERGASVNAFDIIGSHYGLDLSGLFDDVVRRKRRVFRVNEGVGAVAERLVEVGGGFGYEVKSGKGGKIWMRRGRLLLMVEVLEAALELSMVEVVMVEGCRCGPCGGDDCGGGGIGQKMGDIEEVLFKYIV